MPERRLHDRPAGRVGHDWRRGGAQDVETVRIFAGGWLGSMIVNCRSICEEDLAGTFNSSSALTNGRLPQASQGLVEPTVIGAGLLSGTPVVGFTS